MLTNPYCIAKVKASSEFREDTIAIILLTVKWFSNNSGVKKEDNRYVSKFNLIFDCYHYSLSPLK